MNITIHPNKLQGTLRIIPSKSQAHRLLICAAFADRETTLLCPETNDDIEATARCLRSIGAEIIRTGAGYQITPIKQVPDTASMDCGESGSTLRFLLPIVGALGIDTTFLLSGRLPKRPLSPLWEEMCRMGCNLSRPSENTIRCQGQLQCGAYTIDGGVSSQFVTGLLFAISLLKGDSTISITGNTESIPYIKMTQQALSLFGIKTDGYAVHTPHNFITPGVVIVEGDWSNAAFFLAANALGNCIKISDLDPKSPQGDRVCSDWIPQLDDHCVIYAGDIPDLVPILSVVAAEKKGATFENIHRLRLKESDRVQSVISMLSAFGIVSEATENSLTVYPGTFHGGTVDSFFDHRIAMAAAIAATVADGPVTILNAECVAKSYPKFWEEYKRLGGKYE